MQVALTDFAKSELRNIYNYYSEAATAEIAAKIIARILDDIELLEKYPQAGANEQQLAELGREHKNIISGNYKIIFRSHKTTVYITDIFDCRQDPKKIPERNR